MLFEAKDYDHFYTLRTSFNLLELIVGKCVKWDIVELCTTVYSHVGNFVRLIWLLYIVESIYMYNVENNFF